MALIGRNIRFAHAPPVDPSRHTPLPQAPISFNANATAMEFGSAWLDRAYTSWQDHTLGDVHERRLHRNLVDEVRETLVSWKSVGKPSAPAVASGVGLQPQTLNRLLGKTDTSFNRMLEDTRFETRSKCCEILPHQSARTRFGHRLPRV